MSDLQNPVFHDEIKARQWLESQIWPDGPVCPHCGCYEPTALKGKAHRAGLYQCNDCRQQFTATVGTLFERSKIPLSKWLMATYLLSASKKGMSTHQIHRIIGVSYKSTWFMMHRLREAMREGKFPGGLGGQNKVVEADETYVGGKSKNRKRKVPPKEAVSFTVRCDGATAELLAPMKPYFELMARATALDFGPAATPPERSASKSLAGMEVHVDISAFFDVDAERARLEKERDQLTKFTKSIAGKLGNENFVSRAPAEVVQAERDKLAEAGEQLSAVEAALAKL